MTSKVWDVLVIGAGPGGSAAAAFLADAGFSVLVLDRDHFPRFHIGESLLPSGAAVLNKLGITPDPDVFLDKMGAQFVCDATDRVAEFDFSLALPGPPRHAWQVERARFDTILAENAQKCGATVRFGVRVRDFSIDDDGVTLTTDDETFRGRYLIDASGQHRFIATKKRAVLPYPDFGRAAVFTHFHEIRDEVWNDVIGPNFDIRIMMIEDGWIWVIPLAGKRLSVGVVSRRRGIKNEWLDEYIRKSKRLTEWLRGARREEETHIIANFSYRNAEAFGVRYACVGDAWCFLDPVFSSGANLALRSADSLCQALIPALKEQREQAADLTAEHEAYMQRAIDTFSALIFRFYHTNIVDNLIFDVPPDGDLRANITSVFAGDVFRYDNAFQDMLLHSHIRPEPGKSLLKDGVYQRPRVKSSVS